MAGPALSPRERRILAAVEADLRRETSLDFALRTMAAPRERLGARLLDRCGRIQLDWVVLLVACGLALATMAVELRTAALTACAVAFWALTCLLAAARAAGRRRSRGAYRR